MNWLKLVKSEGKKSDMKEYIHYDLIYIKFKSSQTIL